MVSVLFLYGDLETAVVGPWPTVAISFPGPIVSYVPASVGSRPTGAFFSTAGLLLTGVVSVLFLSGDLEFAGGAISFPGPIVS